MNSSHHVSGLQELDDRLTALGAAVGKKVLRRSARHAMQPVLHRMRAGAGVDSGELTAGISISSKIQDKNAGRKNAVAVRVGPKKNAFIKAIAQEFGTSKQPAVPFMRPALAESTSQVITRFSTALATEIERAAHD
ncbi:MAG: HK97 gp10 family phage protein [Cellvibrionaceae bacterium]|nr:HK97 gp10 family phage protein [Cellvibrionaceae bacterium]